jgi:ribulose-5-phosphate 4-epimerase/fuculose-1-phosphate aldolase
MLSQNAIRFHNRVGYHAFEGITETFDERDRIVRDLGKNRALIMYNHGLVTVGASVPEAYKLMKYLYSSAKIQLMLEATGKELIEIPAKLCEEAAQQYANHDRGRATADWPAAKRLLDAIDPSYAT